MGNIHSPLQGTGGSNTSIVSDVVSYIGNSSTRTRSTSSCCGQTIRKHGLGLGVGSWELGVRAWDPVDRLCKLDDVRRTVQVLALRGQDSSSKLLTID